MRPTTATTSTTSISHRNQTRHSSSSSTRAQHHSGVGYYSAVPSSSSTSTSSRRAHTTSSTSSDHQFAPEDAAAFQDAQEYNDIDTEDATNTNNMMEESDCLMIRVQENEDPDDNGSDHSSFATAPASLSAATRRIPQHDDDDSNNAEDLRSIVIRSSSDIPWYHRHWLCNEDPEAWQIKHVSLAEGPAFVRFAKFVMITFASIWIMFYLVRYLNWEHDSTLRLRDLWRYEGNLIFTDSLFYFIVGRLYRQRGIDHFQWLAILAASMFYSSAVTNFRMFQHAFTLYEMHCRWPWQLWLFCALAVPVIISVAVAHFMYAWRRGWVVQKCLEVTFCLTFLLFPLITSSYFHLHHWFAGFLVGMHCNYNVWWSRATLAWCWGAYLNGIAVYGRDPVLTCEYALFLAVTQRCPFVDCYIAAMNRNWTDSNNETVQEMKHPDWHNCSADAYHP